MDYSANLSQTKHELTEEVFNTLLPDYLKFASRLYFTPIHIAQIAAQWLTEDGNKKILDIGAGVGKFCITGGAKNSDSFFYGVEHRPSLAKLGNQLVKSYELKNVIIHNKNILQVDFSNYNAFYLYNPFYENIECSKRLNDEVKLEAELYQTYSAYTDKQLDKAKSGTRLVTFHGNNFEVPNSYKKEKETFDGTLKLWIRQ